MLFSRLVVTGEDVARRDRQRACPRRILSARSEGPRQPELCVGNGDRVRIMSLLQLQRALEVARGAGRIAASKPRRAQPVQRVSDLVMCRAELRLEDP